jgi:uncharacterized cupin superfamily protein
MTDGDAHLSFAEHTLAPGSDLGPYRYDHGNESWLLVLAGQLSVRHPGGEETLDPGDLVCFPDGPDGARQITNRTGVEVRLLVMTTISEPSVQVHPDLGTITVSPPGKVFRLADAIRANR